MMREFSLFISLEMFENSIFSSNSRLLFSDSIGSYLIIVVAIIIGVVVAVASSFMSTRAVPSYRFLVFLISNFKLTQPNQRNPLLGYSARSESKSKPELKLKPELANQE